MRPIGEPSAPDTIRGMFRTLFPSVVLASGLALPVALAALPTPVPAAQEPDERKYPGFMALVKAHKETQGKMVKLWQAIKAGDTSEKTREAYKAAQDVNQKAANKVTKFIEQEKWSTEDRDAMSKIWSRELEKAD